MPTYEYACRQCGEHLEVVQSFRDDPLDTCGVCGGTLRKVFSAAGIIFKGSGYYVTDTRSAQHAASSPSSNGTKGEAGGASGEAGGSSGASGESGGSSDSSSASGSASSEGSTAKSA